MDRVLQCLFCITAMSSVLSQQGYYYQQHQFQIEYPANVHSSQARILKYNHQPTENLYSSTETRKYKLERIENPRIENPRIANGTKHLQLMKRGGLITHLYRILLMELRDTIGTIDESDLKHRIVFPDEISTPRITEECKKRGFCSANEVDNYPELEAEKLTLQGKVKKQIDSPDEYDEVQIAQRLGGDTTELEIPLCASNRTMIYPRTLPDNNGVHHFVVNPNANPVQGFFVELCEFANTNQPAGCHPLATFQDGYRGTCRQKFVYRMVDVIEGNQHVQKKLRLPGCCSCSITRSGK